MPLLPISLISQLASPQMQLIIMAPLQLLSIALSLLYFALFWVKANGATLGQKLFGIRVVRMDGAPISFATAVMRWVGYIISMIPLFLGFLWMLWDKQKQGWHDKIAGTKVIQTDNKSKVAQGCGVLIFAFVLYAVVFSLVFTMGIFKGMLGTVEEQSLTLPQTQFEQDVGKEEQVQSLTNSAISKFSTASQMSRDSEVSSKEQEEIARLLGSAIADLKEAASLDSQNPDVWVNLGDLYASMVGSVEDANLWAVQSYQKALGLLPANHPSRSILERKISQLE